MYSVMLSAQYVTVLYWLYFSVLLCCSIVLLVFFWSAIPWNSKWSAGVPKISWWRWSGGFSSNWSSKAFDGIDQELLITKLYTYRFDKNPCILFNSYLKGRTQRTKINYSYSTFAEILFSVPQGSVLVPLLFNMWKK